MSQRTKRIALAACLLAFISGTGDLNAQSAETSFVSSVDVKSLSGESGLLSTNLAGRIPGLMVMQGSGIPGDGASLWIRGLNMSGIDATPLVIVDGSERDIDLVNVEDLESIYVLKDVSATALYGVRGSNGVIIITTKRGGESAPKVSFNALYGVSQPLSVPRMASSGEWISYYNDLCTQTGAAAPFTKEETDRYLSGDKPDRYPSVDWLDEILNELAFTSKINVNVSGGTSRVRYYISGSYYNEGGVFNVDKSNKYNSQINYDSFNFLSNMDIRLSKSTLLNFNISTQYTSLNSPVTSVSTIMRNAMTCSPIAVPVKYSDGSFAEPQDPDGVNPYNDINARGYKKSGTMYAQSHIAFTQDFSSLITQGLKANVKFSWSTSNGNTLSRYRNPIYYYIDVDNPYDSDGSLNLYTKNNGSNYLTLGKSVSSSTIFNLEPSVVYDRTFGGSRISASALCSMRYMTQNVPSTYIYAYPYKHLSVGGRAGYSFKKRYFIDLALCYSGSDNFEKGYRYELYPSAALAYDISEEPFWNGLKDIVSGLRLKGSYGRSGSDLTGSASRRYVFNSTLDTGASGATFGSTAQNTPTGITTQYYGNSGLVMESALKGDAGIEIQLFRELTISGDYYTEKREGIFLSDSNLPAEAGLTTQYKNVGRLDKHGIELSANYEHSFSDDLHAGVYGEYTFNRDKIITDAVPQQLESYQNREGCPLNQQFGLVAIGLFGSQEEIDNSPEQKFGVVNPGDIKYKDQNNDNVIDSYDMVAIGRSSTPEVNYGFGFNVIFKRIDFSVHCAGSANVTRIISGASLYGGASNVLTSGQIYKDVALGRWTLDNQDSSAEYPRMYLEGSSNNSVASSWWSRDMSFLRVRNVDLGYSFKKGMRVFVSLVNPLTISSFKLWDPELTCNGGVAYPRMKSYVFGLNLNF